MVIKGRLKRFLPRVTETEMREKETPRPRSLLALLWYIVAVVFKRHDYGSGAYAMTLAAVAAFNYVSHKIGASGFQASCADLAILRHTRHWDFGRLIDYSLLLYPQYCNDDFYGWREIIAANREEFAKRAQEKIDQEEPGGQNRAAPSVLAHWLWLAEASRSDR